MIGLSAFGQSIASGIKKLQQPQNAGNPPAVQANQPAQQPEWTKNRDMAGNHLKQPMLGSRLNLMA